MPFYEKRTNDARHLGGPVAGIEAADLGPRLAEHRVVGGDGEVADQVQHVAAAHAVPRHLRHHRLRQPPDLDLRKQRRPLSAVGWGVIAQRRHRSHDGCNASRTRLDKSKCWLSLAAGGQLLTEEREGSTGYARRVLSSRPLVARLQVQDVEARHAVGADVAALTADLLVAAAAERQRTLACAPVSAVQNVTSWHCRMLCIRLRVQHNP